MSFKQNIVEIVKEMMKKFPLDQVQASLFNGEVAHDESITSQEFLLNVAKRA